MQTKNVEVIYFIFLQLWLSLTFIDQLWLLRWLSLTYFDFCWLFLFLDSDEGSFTKSRNANQIEEIEREIQEIERTSSFLILPADSQPSSSEGELDRYKREAKEYLKQIEQLNRQLFDANEKIMQKELKVAQLEIDGIYW